jgi:branched-chain amino acid transport system substrate-binding protein
VPERELEGIYTCLDFLHTVEDPFSQELLTQYRAMFPNTKYKFTAGSASTGVYRGIKLYEQAVIKTKGDLDREAVAPALDTAAIDKGPGGPAKVVSGTNHVAMNMYIGRAKGGKYEIIETDEMVDPKECGEGVKRL